MGPVAQLALDARAILGESPVGLADGRVLFVDINGRRILGWDSVAGRALPEVAPAQMPGCIAPRESFPGVVAGLEDCVAYLPLDPAEPSNPAQHTVLAPLPEHLKGEKKRCNDGKCDPQGRFWVGTMHNSWRDEAAPRGGLLLLQPQADGDGNGWSLTERVAGTRLANGLAWSADSKLLYFIDSALMRVDCFDFDSASGSVTNRRTVVTFAESEPGVPDGMAIDASGKLWVVVGESASVRQVDPETGNEILRVALPVQRPTSCAFGGRDLSELYITTREEAGSQPHPNAGGLFKVLVPGAKGPSFADFFRG